MNRLDAARDKSHNEQQKSVLLREWTTMKHQKEYAALREDTEKIIEKSKALYDKSRKLVAGNSERSTEKSRKKRKSS